MRMLDDPTLMQRPTIVASPPSGGRIRFRPSSTFARDFGVPQGAIGVVSATYEHDGAKSVNLMIAGFGFAAGVRIDEMEAVE